MTRDEIIKRIEHDNNRIMLYKRVMPHILDVLNKYKGKQYGEKTKEKIRQELIEKTGCAVYLYNSWHEDITIVPLNSEGYTDYRYNYQDFNIYVKYPKRDEKRPLSNSNTIYGGFEFTDFTLSNCHEYVNNPKEHADNILASFKVLEEQIREAERNITVFNNMLPSSMEQHHIRGFRYYL